MSILAFFVLAGLGLVVFLTYTKRQRNRDRWPYNLANTDTPSSGNASSSDSSWSPTANTLIAAGTLTVLNDDNASANATQSDETLQANEATETSSSWSEHGATGSWRESGDSDSSTDSGDSDSGGDSGGSND